MRELLAGAKGSSGTMYWQIAKDCKEKKQDFRYLCLALQEQANPRSLIEKLKKILCTTFIEKISYIKKKK